MKKFTAEETQEWFTACVKGDARKMQAMLKDGFDVDTRDADGKSGLLHLCESKDKHRNMCNSMNTLCGALDKRYGKTDPAAYYKALTDGNPALAIYEAYPFEEYNQMISGRAGHAYETMLMNGAKAQDPEFWFKAAIPFQNEAIEAYLKGGFDPDARNEEGKSALQLLGESSGFIRCTSKSAMLVLKALEKKYTNEPQRLIDALEHGDPLPQFYEDDRKNIKKYYNQLLSAANGKLKRENKDHTAEIAQWTERTSQGFSEGMSL